MTPEELRPNSHKYNASKEEKEVKKVASVGKVVTRKRSVGKKLSNIFFAEDVGSVKDYLIFEVIIPAVKDGIADMLTSGISMMFYGTANKAGRRPGNGSYVSYNNYSSKPVGQRDRTRVRSLYSYDDIILETRVEAEDVMEMLNEILDKYGQVTVADLYDAVGVTGNGYTDNQYGWIDLSGAHVQRCREGYLLNMPRCIDLN